MIKLEIIFERRLFGTPEGSFSVFSARPIGDGRRKVKVDSRYNTFTISGDYFIDDEEMDKKFTVTVVEDTKARYENSYKLIRLHYDLPKTSIDQWGYLETLLTPLQLSEFSKVFNTKDLIIDKIINNPSEIEKVKYFGKDRAESLREKVLEDQGKALLFNRFGNIDGVGPAVIKEIYNWLPSVIDAIDRIEKNPFVLMKLSKVGFVIADKFREALNMDPNSEERCLYGLEYFLSEGFQSSGDTYSSISGAIQFAAKKLSVSSLTMKNHIEKLTGDPKLQELYKLRTFGKFITTKTLYAAEENIYKTLMYLQTDKLNILPHDKWLKNKNDVLKEYSSESDSELTDEQNKFLEMINTERVSLLIGPGGAGKSWVTNLAVKMLQAAGVSFGLFAPTARAAHVMTEYIGFEAQTVHRGLYRYYAEESKAPFNVFFVDEASMIDSELMDVIVSTMPTHGRLVIIGDDFQLPSVGPGNVLYNLINDLEVPMVKLTKIFRQNEGSHILEAATRIRENSFSLPTENSKIEHSDIVFINKKNAEEINEIALEYYKGAAKRIKDIKDIMFLSPVNKGVNGRKYLNKKIQAIVNPGNRPAMIFGKNLENEDDKTYYKEGDYIAVQKNDYSREDEYGDIYSIINGDLGEVVIADDSMLYAKINDLRFKFTKEEVTESLEHAWAITIHKSQGGQADEVIIIVPETSGRFLSANMLYTAITRTRKKCIIIGDFSAINNSAKRFVNFRRKTMLGLKAEIQKRSKVKQKK